jgi:sugar/nucleoside kinase (ribokinase family)
MSPSTAMPPDSRRGIVAAGHWIVDHVKRIDRWPEPATLARIERPQMCNGGFAFNLLADLAALDPECPLFAGGLIGDDANGKFIRERCRELKVNDAMLRSTTEFPTSFTDVMTEQRTGRRTFFHFPGTNAHLKESDLRPLNSSAKIFCLGYLGFLPALDAPAVNGLNASARLLRDARSAGMMTAADLVSAPNPHLRRQLSPCFPHLDFLFLNEWEAAQLLKAKPPRTMTMRQAQNMARAVRKLGVCGAVVLHSPEGVVVVADEKNIFAQGAIRLPVRQIQGTVGAGDALAAGVLLARYHDMPWPEALKLGVGAAAACLGSPTPSDGVLLWRQCLKWGERFGFKKFH